MTARPTRLVRDLPVLCRHAGPPGAARRSSTRPGYLAAAGTDGRPTEVFRLARRAGRRPTLDDARRHIVPRAGRIGRAGDRLPYAQLDAVTGEFAGTTRSTTSSPQPRTLAIGHTWLGTRWWRTGHNTESKLLLLTHAFDDARRGARRLAHRHLQRTFAGGHRPARRDSEGVLRKHRIRRDGSWRDTVQYSMTDDDWPAVHDGSGRVWPTADRRTDRHADPVSVPEGTLATMARLLPRAQAWFDGAFAAAHAGPAGCLGSDRTRRAHLGRRADRLGQDVGRLPVRTRPAGRAADAGRAAAALPRALRQPAEGAGRRRRTQPAIAAWRASARRPRRLGLPEPDITVAMRSGDTSADDRRLFARRPADILITTPESLFLLLTSAGPRGAARASRRSSSTRCMRSRRPSAVHIWR